jgi:hypothetical protein
MSASGLGRGGHVVALLAGLPSEQTDLPLERLLAIEEATLSFARAVIAGEGQLVVLASPGIAEMVGLVAGEYEAVRRTESLEQDRRPRVILRDGGDLQDAERPAFPGARWRSSDAIVEELYRAEAALVIGYVGFDEVTSLMRAVPRVEFVLETLPEQLRAELREQRGQRLGDGEPIDVAHGLDELSAELEAGGLAPYPYVMQQLLGRWRDSGYAARG